jgi:zinc transport system permease protein
MSWLFDPIRQHVQAWALAGDLPGAFQYAFVINALICGFFIGPILGGVGTMVVTKRLAFFSQAVGQAALTGVALGIIMGEPLTAPYVSLFGFCILFGLVLNFTKNRTKMSTDTLIGVFLSISMAVGSSLLIFVASKVNIHIVDQVLFGSILTVNNLDMTVLVVISALVTILGVARFNRMLVASFNPQLAHVRGVNVAFLDYLFILMITVITVASVKIIGAMLVEALLLIPAAAARIVTRTIRGFFICTIVISTISCIVGIIAPMLWNLPVQSGGSIVLVTAVFFCMAASFRLFRRQAM